MGWQSSRIYYKHKDHKDMITYGPNGYQVHKQAYIWTDNGFELVWQKLAFGMKLLYETTNSITPVASKNDLYLYFSEGSSASQIYRLVIDDRTPEKAVQFEDEDLKSWSAPTTSQGIGIQYKIKNALEFEYKMLDLERGVYASHDVFSYTEISELASAIPGPRIKSQDLSKGLAGGNYSSSLETFNWGGSYQPWNFLYFYGLTGVSAMILDNREGAGSLLNGDFYSLGRISAEETSRSLLPRFIKITETNVAVYEFGAGTQYGLYRVSFSDDLPFTIRTSSITNFKNKTAVRDSKFYALDTDMKIWKVAINDNDFSYTDTGMTATGSTIGGFDVSADEQYLIVSEGVYLNYWMTGVKIIRMKTGAEVYRFNDSEHITNFFFVGNRCLFILTYEGKRRLYKWR